MRTDNSDVDVLIVGAGPVGLFLANECARRRMSWRLIEARPTQSEHSKALAIFPRTMEIFDMAGVVGPFLARANRVTKAAIATHGRALAHMRFEPGDTAYPYVAMVPQDVTEKLLVEALRNKGGDVEYETTFVAAEPRGRDVSVALQRKGESLGLRARFVVGCDGAHSAVRHALNLEFGGGEYRQTFLLADIQTNDTLPADEMQLCPSELGPLAVFPMSATRRRIVATVDDAEGDAPSLALIQKILTERATKELEAKSLHWSSYFRIHHRHVTQLRAGNVFLAGDAAHIHSPFGGQGMNTGLHDAWNLAWKLDLFLRGHGNERLLDSYAAERLPVIKNVIETTDFLTRAMGTPNRLVQALRNAVIPMVSRLAPFQHAFVQKLSELGIAYKGSPIVEGPGKRYWDDSLRGGNGIGRRFILMLERDAGASVQETAVQLCDTLRDVVALRRSPNAGLTLVRPDGYIAHAAPRDAGPDAVATMRSLLERQTDADKTGAEHS